MILLGEISRFNNKQITELVIDDNSLLLIHHNNQFHLIENKCGHFGVPLLDGDIRGDEIICSQHHISFSLLTGKVVNRPYENCDMIRVFKVVQEGLNLYLDGTV